MTVSPTAIRCRPCRISKCGDCKGRAEGCQCEHPNYNPHDEVIWAEPTGGRRANKNWKPNSKKLDTLIRNPGRWGIIETFPNVSAAGNYKNKFSKDPEFSNFEFGYSKDAKNKESHLHAKYIGDIK